MFEKYLCSCKIKNEHILNIKDVLNFHNIIHFVRMNSVKRKEFVIEINSKSSNKSFYLNPVGKKFNSAICEDHKFVNFDLENKSFHELISPENTGILIAHYILKECKKCVLGVKK